MCATVCYLDACSASINDQIKASDSTARPSVPFCSSWILPYSNVDLTKVKECDLHIILK